MASATLTATPKIRSRKDGAAVPLDDLDTQPAEPDAGQLPDRAAPLRRASPTRPRCPRSEVLAPRPGGCSTSGSSARSRRSTTRARSATARCSSPRRSTPSTRGAPAKIINSHPGVSHNYLRNHEFNMWFTIAVEEDSKLGLQGTLDVLAGADRRRVDPPAADAQAVQDPHGPRDGGRHRGRSPRAGVAAGAGRARAAALRRVRRRRRSARRRATCRSSPSPTRRPPRELGIASDALLEHLRGHAASAGCCAASPRSSSTAAPASAPTAWASGRCPRSGSSSSARGWPPFRGISPLLPAPDLRGLALLRLHDGPRPLEGGVRRDPRRDRRRDDGIEERATLYSSTEFKKIRLLYFTDDFKRLGARARRRLSAGPDRRLADRHHAPPSCTRAPCSVLPGGVNSPVRAMRAIGRDPLFVDRARGRRARRRRRQPLRRLRLLVGPADPRPRAPGDRRGGRRRPRRAARRFGAPTRRRGRARRGGRARAMPSVEMLRMTSSGTEASMSAIRLARAATGREKLLKFAGAYHGHVDGLLAEAGSGPGDAGDPRAARRARRRRRPTRSIVPWNDARAPSRRRAPSTSSPRSSPSPTRRTWASSRRAEGFLELLREQADATGALLVFDEVITRLPRRAAAARRSATGVTPDLTVMGKVIGGGLPAAAYGGSRDADGAHRAGRRRLPGGHAEREPARRRRRAWRRCALLDDAGLRCGCAATTEALADGPARGRGRRPAGRRSRRVPGPADRLLHATSRVARLRRRAGLRPRGLRRLVPRAARPRRLPAAVAVRGLVPVAGPHRRARRAHARGRGGRVRRARVSAPSALRAARGALRDEGGLLADALRATAAGAATPLGDARRAGPRAAGARADVALVVEAVREGYLLHYGAPRRRRAPTTDLALLAGDRLYALGLARLAALGDLDAVARARRRHLALRAGPRRRRPSSPRRPGRPARRRSAGAPTPSSQPRRRPRATARPSARACARRAPRRATWRTAAERRPQRLAPRQTRRRYGSRPEPDRPPEQTKSQVHRRPRIPGAFEGETVTRRRFMTGTAHAAGAVADRRVRAAGARLRARPGLREARAAAGRPSAPLDDFTDDTYVPKVDHDRRRHRRGRQDDGLRAQAQPGDRHASRRTEYNAVRRDLDALHAPRLPGPLRRGRRSASSARATAASTTSAARSTAARRCARSTASTRACATASVEIGPRFSRQQRARALLAARPGRAARRHRPVPLPVAAHRSASSPEP